MSERNPPPSTPRPEPPAALTPTEPEALQFLAKNNGVEISREYPPHLVLYDAAEKTRVLYVCRDPRLAVAFLLGLSCGREKR